MSDEQHIDEAEEQDDLEVQDEADDVKGGGFHGNVTHKPESLHGGITHKPEGFRG